MQLKLQGFVTDDDNTIQTYTTMAHLQPTSGLSVDELLLKPWDVDDLFSDCDACKQILPAAILLASADKTFCGQTSDVLDC